MTNQDLINIGFKEMPHFTVGNSVFYDLGRNRQLSASCVGTPNEMLFICEINPDNKNEITDLVCLHNYEYDKYLTLKKVKSIISAISTTAELYNSEIIDEIFDSIDPAELKKVECQMMFAVELYDFIKNKGISQTQFAELMNETEDTITEWLSGTCFFTEEKKQEIWNKLNTEISYFFDKTYEGINFKISNYNTININTLIIDNQFIDEIDIVEIVENERYFESIVPKYIKELIDMTDIIKDVNESMRELYKTWQW